MWWVYQKEGDEVGGVDLDIVSFVTVHNGEVIHTGQSRLNEERFVCCG